MAVFMPMTSPAISTSGPPELPGLMAASVWMNCWNWTLRWGRDRRWSGSWRRRCPRRRSAERPKGSPMASTQSPTCAPSELPSLTVGSGWGASILMTAMSVSGSTPITCAGRPCRVVVGIGGELDVDLVGLVDDVVVGDDVAARVDDKAGAQGLALAAAVGAVISARAALAAEEAVEEVLHVALVAADCPGRRATGMIWPRRWSAGWRTAWGWSRC